MTGKIWAHILFATCLGTAVVLAEDDAIALPPMEIVISVAEQKLALVKDGGLLKKYPISTSKFGLGDSYNSYKTPLGRLRVCDKIGDNLSIGAVLKSRNATGEILPANAPGRDPIVTRILWLEGLDAGNTNAKARGIYIHGTVEESRLGQPVSYGCIRMRSRDVVELFDDTPVGTPVEIIADRFPRFRKASPKTEILVASNDAVTTTVGPHGLVVVKTVRGGEPQMVAKEKGTSNRTLFADGKEAASPTVGDKPADATLKTLAKNIPSPTPIGPKVVLAPPPPAEPRVMFAMTGSILESDLRKPAKTQPEATSGARVESRIAGAPEALRSVVLQLIAPLDLFASNSARNAPLDELSALLLNPPAPQFRLAFRATAPVPEL